MESRGTPKRGNLGIKTMGAGGGNPQTASNSYTTTMKFILFLLTCVVVTVSAGLGDSVSDFVSNFKDATKDHVSERHCHLHGDCGSLGLDSAIQERIR